MIEADRKGCRSPPSQKPDDTAQGNCDFRRVLLLQHIDRSAGFCDQPASAGSYYHTIRSRHTMSTYRIAARENSLWTVFVNNPSKRLTAYSPEGTNPDRRFNLRDAALLALKLTVTGGCFWYISRQVNVADILRIADTLDFKWVGFAILVAMFQIPLAGLRWRAIVDALGAEGERTPAGPMIAITAIGVFFGQILPNVAGEAMRVWMLARLGRSWGRGVTSVLIDRGVGVFMLLFLAFVILLFPSDFTELGGYRVVLDLILGATLFVGLLGLFLVPSVSPVLQRWRYTRYIAKFARAVHHVFVGSMAGLSVLAIALAVHTLSILSIWSLARSQGLALSVFEVAVLFTMIVAMALVPITISGWGLREVAVTTLLQSHGVPAEQALFFSVCYGLVLVIASLPGAIVWAVYSTAPPAGRRYLQE